MEWGLVGGRAAPSVILGGMASEITVTIWTDAIVDASVAWATAAEAATSLRRSTGLNAEVAAFSSRRCEPSDVVSAPETAPKRRRQGKSTQ